MTEAERKHLDQWIEKAEFPRTHNLDLLLQSCISHSKDFAVIDLKNLEDFAVRGRYPHDFLQPDAAETSEFLKIAEAVKALVLKKIS